MKRLITLFLVAAVTMFFFSCSENNPIAPELNQSDQVTSTFAKKTASSLNCTITYDFVAHLDIFDGEGRLFLWDGEIKGDIEGKILWWLVVQEATGPPNMPEAAPLSFYEARWEIFVDDVFVLAGESGGKTVTPKGKEDGIWRGNGIVTEAYAGYEDWIGRNISESGSVIWDFPYFGNGIFRIN